MAVTNDAAAAPAQRTDALAEESLPVEDAIPGIAAHPHARAVLGAALAARARPSHAYLFYGPAGSGKRAVARAFAAALLAEGARNPATVAQRVARDAHPDLTWVTPSGAAEMLVSDIEEPVVAAATRTPFESARRVFVIDAVEKMNDQAANRMLKTLEEPPAFVHLLLVTDRRDDVLPTITSRCQLVRFDPAPSERIAAALSSPDDEPSALDAERARACARLALGDAHLAAHLASADGEELRSAAQGFIRAALAGTAASRPWLALLELAAAEAERAAERAAAALASELELLPAKERKRHEREALESRRRAERRARLHALDAALALAELWLRDVLCVCEDASELIYAVDRRDEITRDADARDPAPLRDALEQIARARLSLTLNVSEELALEALAYRLEALLAS